MVLHWSKSQEFTNNFNSSLKSAMEFMLQRSKPAINLALSPPMHHAKTGFSFVLRPLNQGCVYKHFKGVFFIIFVPFYPEAELMINMLCNTRI